MADYVLLDPVRFTSMEVSTSPVSIRSGTYIIATASAAYYGIMAQGAMIECETKGVRYTIHGDAPATNVGHTLNTGDIVVLYSYIALQNFKALQTDASTATLQLTIFYGT